MAYTSSHTGKKLLQFEIRIPLHSFSIILVSIFNVFAPCQTIFLKVLKVNGLWESTSCGCVQSNLLDDSNTQLFWGRFSDSCYSAVSCGAENDRWRQELRVSVSSVGKIVFLYVRKGMGMSSFSNLLRLYSSMLKFVRIYFQGSVFWNHFHRTFGLGFSCATKTQTPPIWWYELLTYSNG